MGSGVKVGELYGELRLDKGQYDKTLSETEKSTKGWASNVGGHIAGAGEAFVKFGALGTAALGAVAYKVGDMASDMNEARSKVGVVFGDMSGTIEAFAKTAPKAMGMSETAALTAMGTYGNLFRAMKIGTPAATDMSSNLTQLAADLASFNNLDPTDVLDKLRAGLVGEAEPLRSLGVNLNQAGIEAEAMRLKLWDGKGTIDAAAKAQASYSLIMQQTSLAQGDFARTSGGMANQQRILGATFETTMAAVGQAFIPIIQMILPQITAGLQTFAAWVQANMPTIQAVFEAAMAGLGVAVQFVTDTVIPALSAAFQWVVANVLPLFQSAAENVTANVLPALSTAFSVITDTIIPALGQVFDWLVANVLPPVQAIFQAWIDNILPLLGKAFEFVQKWIADNWPLISKIVDQVAGAVKTAFDMIAEIIKVVYPIIAKVAEVLFPVLGAAASAMGEILTRVFDAIGVIWQTAADVADTVVKAIFGSWDGMGKFFENTWNAINGAIKGGINFMIGLINGMIGFLNGIQFHIPGFETPFGTVAKFDWAGMNLPKIPYLAKGVRNFSGGWAIAGEKGPELLNLPRGANVFSNSDSSSMLGGGTFYATFYVTKDQTPEEFARESLQALKREVVRQGMSLA